MKKKNIKKRFFAYFLLSYLLLLTSYENFAQTSTPFSNISVSDCADQLSENLNGWGLFWKNSPTSQVNYLSDNSSSSFLMGTTSTTSIVTEVNSISLVNQNEFSNDTGIFSTPDFDEGDDAFYVRLGGNLDNLLHGSEEIVRKQYITPQQSELRLTVFVVFQNESENLSTAYCKGKISVKYNDGTFLSLPNEVSTFLITANSEKYRTYNGKYIINGSLNFDFSEYNIDFCKNPEITYSIMVSDGDVSEDIDDYHSNVYAYVKGSCHDQFLILPPPEVNSLHEGQKMCTNFTYTFSVSEKLSVFIDSDDTTEWRIKKESGEVIQEFSGNYESIVYTFLDEGSYTIELKVIKNTNSQGGCEFNFEFEGLLFISNCSVTYICPDCTSFSLLKNQKYVVSGWTKLMYEVGSNEYEEFEPKPKYENVYIGLSFFDASLLLIGSAIKFEPSGEIIDGWQKIQGEIVIPNNVDDIKISLVNENDDNISAFFDDIRVHPFNGNLKSFVYDQASQKLMAELDENNYATFYEYDKEGGLIRVKKETERGIYTIQETRSSTKKN